MTILTHAERQRYWNWCREFIDREAIYRADETHPAIPGKFGGMYRWQFYTAVGALIDALPTVATLMAACPARFPVNSH